MKRIACMAFVIAFVALAAPSLSEAKFELSLSLGGNYDLLVNSPKDSERVGLNLELLPSFRLAIISLDLGIMYDFLKKHVMLRPGIRIFLGWFFFRVALPVVFSHAKPIDDMFNLGALAGIGVQLRVKKFFFLLEANVSPFFIKIDNRGVLLPAEVRLGGGVEF